MLNVLFKIKSLRKCQAFPAPNGIKRNRGMSYVELIVVLSIFSAMTSVILFNYGEFQTKIDTKNLASDIALRIVEAQKSSLSGKLPPFPQRSLISSTWKPSYGIYFNLVSDNKSFIYFTDINNNTLYEGSACTDECLEKITITKGNSISSLNVFYRNNPTAYGFNDLTLTFSRLGGTAAIKSTTPFTATISYIQIVVVSPKSATAGIKLYPSGRIEVN